MSDEIDIAFGCELDGPACQDFIAEGRCGCGYEIEKAYKKLRTERDELRAEVARLREAGQYVLDGFVEVRRKSDNVFIQYTCHEGDDPDAECPVKMGESGLNRLRKALSEGGDAQSLNKAEGSREGEKE